MTTYDKPYPVVEYLIGVFGDWLNYRRELNDLRLLDTASFNRIAGDLRIPATDLNELVRQGPHAADELPKLLKALGIDEAALERTEPLVLRDMERICSLCNHKRQCNRDLAAGSSPGDYHQYCLNASTIDDLGQPIKH